MKLKELHEMAVLIGEWKFTPDIGAIVHKLLAGKEITKLENGDYSIWENNGEFGLFKEQKFLAFAKLKNVEIHDKKYREVVVMYAPQENRKQGLTTALLYALKELDKIPLLFDNAIFDDGWAYLKSVHSQHNTKFHSIYHLDKNTGEIKDFDDMAPVKNKDAFIIENDQMGFYRDYGAIGRVYFNMFEKELGTK